MNALLIFGRDGRFASIAGNLCRAIAACLGKGLMDAGMIVLVWQRVRRVEADLRALAERIASGRYRGGRVLPVRPEGAVRRDRAAVSNPLPRRSAWLIRLMPSVAAGYGSQLAALLAEPEVAALLRDVPQALRILRPLCRALGVVVQPVVSAGLAVADVLAGPIVEPDFTRHDRAWAPMMPGDDAQGWSSKPI